METLLKNGVTMERKLEDVKNLIGQTPLLKIIYRYNGEVRNAFMKAEWFNMSGSIKDRVAYSIIQHAYKIGALKKGQAIVETTSGNMGLSFCALGAFLGHPVKIFMPEFMSKERKDLVKLFGGELIYGKSFTELFDRAKEYATKNNCFLPLQFENEFNVEAHIQTTAPEIEKQADEKISAVIAGVGTGGTLIGLSKYFKSKDKSVQAFAVEPQQSSLLTFGKSKGKHRIQGLSDEIIPPIYNREFVDKIIAVDDNDAIAMAQKLSKELGLPVGISGGANFIGSVLCGVNNAVSVFADDNKKYLSTDLATPIETTLTKNIELLSCKVFR